MLPRNVAEAFTMFDSFARRLKPQGFVPTCKMLMMQAATTTSDFWRWQLEAVYRKRNPYKLHRVPALLERHKGPLVADSS